MTNSTQVLKSKTKKVYKSNKLNNANFSDFNLNDYRVYLNAIALIGGVTEQGKYIQPKELPREYKLSALDFAKQFNIAPNNAYKILKQATKKLMKTDITIEKPELFQTWQINVCERAVYNEKEGTIDILFTGSIMEYLKQRTKNFTLYNLKEVADLTSIYAVRLYELMQQFNITTGYLIYTVEQWRDIFGVLQDQYKTYNNLKRKVFLQALDEINNKTGYTLIMHEEKEGRKVTRVRFEFETDKILSGVDIRTGEITTRHKKPRKPPPKPIKNQEYGNTPPIEHPDQQELPHIQQEQKKRSKSPVETVVKGIAKSFRAFGAQQDLRIKKSLEEDTSTIDATLEVLKSRAGDIAELAKIIAKRLGISKKEAYEIAKKDFDEEDAKLKPI